MRRVMMNYEFAVAFGFLGGALFGGGIIGSVTEPSALLSLPLGILLAAIAIGHIRVVRRSHE